MELKSYQDGYPWLFSKGIILPHVGVQEEAVGTAYYQLPKDSGHKTALARLIVHGFYEDQAVIFLVEETGIWSSCENEFLFVKFRSTCAPEKGVDDYPFHLARCEETDYVEGLLALSLYFIWGVCILDEEAKLLLRTSHDEYMTVTAKDAEIFDRVTVALTDFGLERFR